MKYEIFTDGACSGNPGPGGWGVLINGPDGARDLCGGAPSTTNNQKRWARCQRVPKFG